MFCHWKLPMPLAPAGQSMQLLICYISRRRLCHRSPQDNQSKSWEKVSPLVLLSLGMVSMTPGTSLLLVYIRLEYLLKIKKELKLFLSVRPSTALASFFLSKYSVSCLQTEMGWCPWWLPLAPAEQSIQLFICHTSGLRLCYRLTTRQFLQWKFIYIHIFRQSI